MIKTIAIAIVVVVALGALLLYAATQPDTFSVQRSASIKAPADKIHPLIDDLHRFNTWNPFDKKDPNVKGSYSGPANGPGAAYAFDGKEVGTGSIRIVESSAPRKVTMQLDMQKPIEGHNTVEFTLTPRGDATEVTWAMRGSSPYIAKLMGVFVNMDRMIGQHFETGLADLKSLAERA
ncbi:MAG: polyketide cyclase [Betaproteobacteria bacterium]|nr:MAG: polyketide cyclase [Betaproteobacteria bacterium]